MNRIFLGVVFGMAFLMKTTASTLPRQFEIYDPGYSAYLGYLMLEHQHANLVLQCFCRFLLTSRRFSTDDNFFVNVSADGAETNTYVSFSPNRRKVQLRWHLCVMLVRNPSLVKFRKHYVQKPESGEMGPYQEKGETSPPQAPQQDTSRKTVFGTFHIGPPATSSASNFDCNC